MCRRLFLGALWTAIALRSFVGAAETSTLEARVLYDSADGVYIDVGSGGGVKAGDAGVILRNGAEIARVEVSAVTRSSALVRIVASPTSERPRQGDVARLQVSSPAESRTTGQPESPESKSPTLKSKADEKEEFVPLLTQPPQNEARVSDSSNAFHGRAWFRQLFQTDAKGSQDYSYSRAGTSGSLERIAGSRWTLEWSGALSYRAGNGYDNSRDKDEIRPDLYRFTLARSYQSGAFVRLGRFLPQELPAVGFLDGVQGEAPVASHLRLGSMVGLKPTRRDLDFSIDEPTAVAYGTVEAGERQGFYYSGTGGVLGSLYQGKVDRMALLLDQRANLGRWLSLYSTTEADVDVGGAETRNGFSLTREDCYATVPLTQWLELRAGLDHYQRPDTAAERDVLRIQSPDFFDNGYWRYWGGTGLRLPAGVDLNGELGYIDSPGEDGFHWRATVAKTGILGWRSASVRCTVYNLLGADADGYGGRLSAYLPFLEGALFFEPAAGFRFLKTDATSESFDLTDLSLRALWQATTSLSFDAGVTYTTGTAIDAWLVDFGVSYRW